MNRTAHVVGGGIAGMSVAACLAKAGWSVTVHERSEELREIGAGIYLKENSVRVLDELGCLEDIVKNGTRIKRSEIRDRHGDSLLSRDVSGERVFTVLRQDLHRELAGTAKRLGVEIRLASQVSRVTPEGIVVDAQGAEHRADLIIGADGLGSIVRSQAGLERSVVRMPNGSTRILAPRSEKDPSEGSIEYWHGHKRVMQVPVGRSLVYFCASSREDDSRGVVLPFDVDYWTHSFPHLADLFSRVTPDMGVHHAHGFVQLHGWQKGRIALIGDSAHGQPPNLGQGAGMAIANGKALVDCLARQKDVGNALSSWERAVRKINEQIQEWSLYWDHFVHRWPLPLEGLRSGVIWSLSTFPATRRHWGRLYRGTDVRIIETPANAASNRSPATVENQAQQGE